jgi:hypothetical protein
MSLAAGTRLGPYQVLGFIGAGGMGEVYKAKTPVSIARSRLKSFPIAFRVIPIAARDLSARQRVSRD